MKFLYAGVAVFILSSNALAANDPIDEGWWVGVDRTYVATRENASLLTIPGIGGSSTLIFDCAKISPLSMQCDRRPFEYYHLVYDPIAHTATLSTEINGVKNTKDFYDEAYLPSTGCLLEKGRWVDFQEYHLQTSDRGRSMEYCYSDSGMNHCYATGLCEITSQASISCENGKYLVNYEKDKHQVELIVDQKQYKQYYYYYDNEYVERHHFLTGEWHLKSGQDDCDNPKALVYLSFPQAEPSQTYIRDAHYKYKDRPYLNMTDAQITNAGKYYYVNMNVLYGGPSKVYYLDQYQNKISGHHHDQRATYLAVEDIKKDDNNTELTRQCIFEKSH